MVLSREEVDRMMRREMVYYIQTHEEYSSIIIASCQVKSFVCKMQKSELKEILLGDPHTRNHENPSWLDLFIEI